jgi:hypothetical protein
MSAFERAFHFAPHMSAFVGKAAGVGFSRLLIAA